MGKVLKKNLNKAWMEFGKITMQAAIVGVFGLVIGTVEGKIDKDTSLYLRKLLFFIFICGAIVLIVSGHLLDREEAKEREMNQSSLK
jgi:hypothetical protein